MAKQQQAKPIGLVGMLSLLAMAVVLCWVTGSVVGWAMEASGWNCFMREVGYSQGLGEPPEQSPHCKKASQ